jgi:hypothetical protein
VRAFVGVASCRAMTSRAALCLALLLAAGLGACDDTTLNPPGGDEDLAGTGDLGTGGPKRVFVTSLTYSGELGGIEGANAKCQLLADAAILGGSFRAWLSTTSKSALDNVTGQGPWFYVVPDDFSDGKVFNNRANLMTRPLLALNRDELGAAVSTTEGAWTGTTLGGSISVGENCSSWTSVLGASGLTGETWSTANRWTEGDLVACDEQRHLYCFEE